MGRPFESRPSAHVCFAYGVPRRNSLAGFGNGVESPEPLAGLRVVGVEEAADAGLRSAHADDHLAVDGQGRRGAAVAGGVVPQRHPPAHRPREGVEGHEVGIERADEDAVAQHRHATIDRRIAQEAQVLRELGLVPPERPSRSDIEGRDPAARLGHVT